MLATSTSSRGKASVPETIAGWRQAVLDGNNAFDQQAYSTALGCYELALALAERMFGRIDDAGTGVAAYVIARHNLADTYERLAHTSEQSRQLCLAHERLCDGMNDPALGVAWQVSAQNHSRHTYAELVRFLGSHPHDQAAKRTIRQGAAGMTSGRRAQ